MKEKIIEKIEKKSASKCKRVASLKPTTSPIKALKEVGVFRGARISSLQAPLKTPAVETMND